MFRNNDISDGGRLVLLEAPDDAVISLADCKKALGISDTASDGVINAALSTVIANLDPASGGWLGRALRPQSWELQLHSFNDRRHALRPYYNTQAIPLPYPPLISVDSVRYLDANGNDTPMTLGTDYRILGQGVPLGIAAIAPLYSAAWPVARIDDASVRIQFTAGYDDDVNATPPQLIQAICLGVRALLPLMQRDAMLLEDRVEGLGWKRYQNNPQFVAPVLENAIGGLLANLRVY